MVDNIKKVSDEFSAAGQISPEDLQQIAQTGFKSVLNLRSPDELGVLPDEQQKAEAAGLAYANVPLSNASPDLEQVNQALQELEDLPKPVLIHCGAGLRAGAIALIATAIHHDLSLDEVTTKSEEFVISEQPHLKQFIKLNRK
jgi:uncharacterized protein (TIGR01244 family)